jgi:peptidoglycan hydrolase-like protein with peptidoglycan-binding domain
MALLRRGLVGEPVRILQQQLGLTADGIFGKDTEAALIQYQTDNGLSADGIAGPDTFTSMGLDELVLLHRPIRGEMVRRLQEGLGIGADGVFGPGTEAAVKKFQEENGLEVTGQAGPETLRHVPGFEVPEEKVEASLVTETTPTIDADGVEQVRVAEDAPPEQESLIAYAVHTAEDAVSNVGKSIWSTVRSIF